MLGDYDARRLPSGEYELRVPYSDDEDLDKTVYELLVECERTADMRHCFTEADAFEEGTDRSW